MSERLPTLHSGHLVLRWLDEADLDALYAIFSDAQALRYWSHPPFATTRDAVRYLDGIRAGFRDDRLYQWGIARREDNAVIGTATLNHIDRGNRRAEIGFILAREHWGRGHVQEILPVLIDHAFGAMGLHRLEADVDPRNEASLKALRRLGFVEEGRLRERWYVGGEPQDSVLLGLLAPEWAARRAAAQR